MHFNRGRRLDWCSIIYNSVADVCTQGLSNGIIWIDRFFFFFHKGFSPAGYNKTHGFRPFGYFLQR